MTIITKAAIIFAEITAQTNTSQMQHYHTPNQKSRPDIINRQEWIVQRQEQIPNAFRVTYDKTASGNKG